MKPLPHDDDNKQQNYFFKALSFFSLIGTTIMACVFIGVFLGRFLDNFLGTSPWLLLVFSMLGMAAAFKAVYNLMSK